MFFNKHIRNKIARPKSKRPINIKNTHTLTHSRRPHKVASCKNESEKWKHKLRYRIRNTKSKTDAKNVERRDGLLLPLLLLLLLLLLLFFCFFYDFLLLLLLLGATLVDVVGSHSWFGEYLCLCVCEVQLFGHVYDGGSHCLCMRVCLYVLYGLSYSVFLLLCVCVCFA